MSTAIINAAHYLQHMTQIWECATKAEQRDLVRGMLDEVICDVGAGRLIALRPKPAFAVLLRRVGGMGEEEGLVRSGHDPEEPEFPIARGCAAG